MKSTISETPTIELETLEDLISFEEEWGPIIIDNNTIEIYNDIRE